LFFNSPKYPMLKPSICWPLKTTTLSYLQWISGSQTPSMVGNDRIMTRWWLHDMASYICKMFEHQLYPLVFFVETYTLQPIFVLWTIASFEKNKENLYFDMNQHPKQSRQVATCKFCQNLHNMTISLKDPYIIHLLSIWLYFANINKTTKIRGQPNIV